MFAETGLMSPYFQSFPQEVHQLDEFYYSQKPNAPLGNLNHTSTILDYNLGGEGDLFNAPEPVIQEPLINLDPMTAAISMISCGENIISPHALNVSAIESSIESGQLLSEVYYECKKDILAKDATVTPLSEVMDIKIPTVKMDEHPNSDEKMLPEGPFQKSVSSGCLSKDWMCDAPLSSNFLIPDMDLGEVYGMRRSFSEGDIKTLGNGNISLLPPSMGQPQIIGSCTSEGRKEKLSRYRSKKTKRNFGRKIKYACRKALADSQPRIRGRFAKTEEICSQEAITPSRTKKYRGR
ncbi:zinc finger CONSTANS-LIKE 10-like isoform X1 [Olea europaea subsp. europaea]|uniref:Zinc finger CONSTANS-LIKE 10-like isoform X1 n=2 Tax=Olea europaea subsp. europaea TaxID=158383 RepID=A0A8S0T4M8_OLEEU|nr:zinc finger CONSTANS-LIKE 10-like isoform X1 [Olea europaea subsp. europaea]